MKFVGTCNFTGTFFNESFVGKFCENLQRNMNGMEWNGMEWDGMGWDGMGWDGMGCMYVCMYVCKYIYYLYVCVCACIFSVLRYIYIYIYINYCYWFLCVAHRHHCITCKKWLKWSHQNGRTTYSNLAGGHLNLNMYYTLLESQVAGWEVPRHNWNITPSKRRQKGWVSSMPGWITTGAHAGAQILVTSITNAEIKVLVEEKFDQHPWVSHAWVDVSCSEACI